MCTFLVIVVLDLLRVICTHLLVAIHNKLLFVKWNIKNIYSQFKLHLTFSFEFCDDLGAHNLRYRKDFWQMLKAPPLISSDLHFLVFQNRPDRGALLCSKMVNARKKRLTLILYAPVQMFLHSSRN